MQIFSKIFNTLLNPFYHTGTVYVTGPNSLNELLKQFNQPPKQKTNEDVIRDYTVKETMAQLEVDMLKMDPTIYYKGFQMCMIMKVTNILIGCLVQQDPK